MIVREREPLASFAAGLAEDLAEQGYSPDSIARHVRLLRRLEQWLAREGAPPG